MALTAEQREADTNDDGLVSKKEARKFNKKNPDRPLADEYTAEQAAAEYGYRVAVINSDPKLQEIFATAVAEEWDTPRFTIAVENWAREAGFGTGSALDAYKKRRRRHCLGARDGSRCRADPPGGPGQGNRYRCHRHQHWSRSPTCNRLDLRRVRHTVGRCTGHVPRSWRC